MSEYAVKVLEAKFITHDVKRFVVEKPEGYDFIPGQATDISINMPDWKDKLRPFTFTSLRESKSLEFMIKLYRDHDGVTNMLSKVNSGDELILHDVFGTLNYKKSGVFLAAGTGITPFIAILRDLYRHNQINGNRLIYVNKTSEDIIMGGELFKMLKKNFLNVLTRENTIGYVEKRIDRNFLIENITDFGQHFYVCGPDNFVKDMSKYLLDLGADVDGMIDGVRIDAATGVVQRKSGEQFDARIGNQFFEDHGVRNTEIEVVLEQQRAELGVGGIEHRLVVVEDARHGGRSAVTMQIDRALQQFAHLRFARHACGGR